MRKLYVICGMYYVGQKLEENDISYAKQMFLGVEGEHRVYVYDDELKERSLTFSTKKAANEYIKEHKLNEKKISVEKHFVLEITIW